MINPSTLNSLLSGQAQNTGQSTQSPSLSSVTNTTPQLPTNTGQTQLNSMSAMQPQAISNLSPPQFNSLVQTQQKNQGIDVKTEIQQALQSPEGQNAIKSMMKDFPQFQSLLNT